MMTVLRVMLVCLVFICISSIAIAGDYIVYDENGIITRRYRSVDGNHPVNREPRHLKIDRDTYNSLTKWHKVDNGKVRKMIQAEKDTILQAEADTRKQAEDKAIKDLRVETKEIITALIQVYNSKVPEQYRVTREEIIQCIKDNRNN